MTEGKDTILCREDLPLLRGQGRYLDDIKLVGTAHVAFVRSPHAHARIRAVDVVEAGRLPGVIRILTGSELRSAIKPIRAALKNPDYRSTDWYPLASDKVRYVGEAVVAVVAESRYLAEDAADQIFVHYEPLPVVANPEIASRPNAPTVHDSIPDNVLLRAKVGAKRQADLFEQAPCRVKATFQHPRVTGLPMENCGILADFQPDTRQLTVYSSNQVPHLLRDSLSSC
jgi:carbon-monoxide dehydrogenase large subunit